MFRIGISGSVTIILILFLFARIANAQPLMVKNSPRPFSIVPPSLWNQAPTTSTGNSRVEFSPPTGSPPASCGVVVKEFHALKSYPQSVLDDEMTEPIDTKEFISKLSSQYNNVKVISAVKSSLSGYVANLYNVVVFQIKWA